MGVIGAEDLTNGKNRLKNRSKYSRGINVRLRYKRAVLDVLITVLQAIGKEINHHAMDNK